MRQISIAVLAIAGPVAAASPVHAADHFQTVNEVLLSTGGNPAAQFVELRATSPQPFPTPPYRLASYDGAGASVGSKTLDSFAMGAAQTNPYLVSTPAADTAFGVTGDEVLPENFLPASGGKVCFEQGMGVRQIACVAYGCPTANPAAQVKSPPDGESLQRQTDATYVLAAPTPKAANASGASAGCIAGGATPDKIPPDQFLAFKKKQDVDKLAVSLTLSEEASVTVRGTVNVSGAAKTFKVKTVKRELAANVKRKFRLRLSGKAKTAIRRALENGKKPKASMRITAEDRAGNLSTKKPKIRLTD